MFQERFQGTSIEKLKVKVKIPIGKCIHEKSMKHKIYKKTTLNSNFFEKNLHNFNSNFINQMKKKKDRKKKDQQKKKKKNYRKLSDANGIY